MMSCGKGWFGESGRHREVKLLGSEKKRGKPVVTDIFRFKIKSGAEFQRVTTDLVQDAGSEVQIFFKPLKNRIRVSFVGDGFISITEISELVGKKIHKKNAGKVFDIDEGIRSIDFTPDELIIGGRQNKREDIFSLILARKNAKAEFPMFEEDILFPYEQLDEAADAHSRKKNNVVFHPKALIGAIERAEGAGEVEGDYTFSVRKTKRGVSFYVLIRKGDQKKHVRAARVATKSIECHTLFDGLQLSSMNINLLMRFLEAAKGPVTMSVMPEGGLFPFRFSSKNALGTFKLYLAEETAELIAGSQQEAPGAGQAEPRGGWREQDMASWFESERRWEERQPQGPPLLLPALLGFFCV